MAVSAVMNINEAAIVSKSV